MQWKLFFMACCFYDPIRSLTNKKHKLFQFFYFYKSPELFLHFPINFHENIRTGSSLKIHYSRWNEISHFTLYPWQNEKKDRKKNRNKRNFSSKYTHNGIGILSWRNGKKENSCKSSNKSTKLQHEIHSVFARVSFGKRQTQRRSFERC